uniref:Kinesin-like protein n=1 Tax=Haemonchus contortus TaxID=6289 RepID=A0A7I4YMP7_HAECO|nr:Kinesin domain containing protein [Haemonchus contortus]
MAESVRVIARCRPLNDREKGLNSKVCVEMDPASAQVTLISDGPPKLFTFDGAYYMDATGEQIYNDIVYPLVENVITGYNGTVFAYGQTGSGKTFSMQGIANIPAQRGIIPRAFEHIFLATATTENMKFLIHCSYLEIYNEEVRDLLGVDKNQKLEIKEHAERGVYVAGLSMHVCHDVKTCHELMDKGFNNRHVGATLMNKDSSRSHSIFTVYVEGMMENGSIRTGKLNLVDLAGSERQSKTGATGDRFKEATKINLSLSALGNVISALVDGKSKHIPYRDSKLTRLLQDSLGGNTKTIMIACISPSDNNYDETLSTLRYANRAKNIKNKPKINEDPKDALLREYQEEIERLKAMLAPGANAAPVPQFDIEAERAKLREELEATMAELREEYRKEQMSKAELAHELQVLKEQYEKANSDLDTMEGLDPNEAARKLEQLQQQFVGGEMADNEQLKQKRTKKLKEAETKMQRLAAALNVHKDDPLLQVYSSTQEKLDAVTAELQREKNRSKALESEIEDLQGEFELDRLDYLETIRKQDQQLKLLTQILEKVQPTLRKESNYYNLEKVKKDAVWNEDEGRWILPEISMTRTVLPTANNGIYNGDKSASFLRDTYDDDSSKLRRKLAKSEEENIANNYFKPIRQSNVLNKYRGDHARSLDVKSYFPNKATTFDNLLSGVVYSDDIYGRSQSARKPARLESLSLKK